MGKIAWGRASLLARGLLRGLFLRKIGRGGEKMRRLIACLLFLTFINPVFIQAEFKFEITQKFKRGEGEITVTGKSLDEVREGVSQTLTRLKCKIVEQDKDEGLIIAWIIEEGNVYLDKEEWTDSVRVRIISGEWKIMIESIEDEKVVLVCAYEGEGAGIWGSKKKSFKNFSEKLKSILER